MPKQKPSTIKLQVFKGREAKLNKTIFKILAHKSPLIPYDIHKEVKTQKGLRHTKYTNVLRRIRALEESGYLEKVGTRKIRTQPESQATLHQLTHRAYLAILLNQISLDYLTQTASEDITVTMLAALAQFQG